MKTTDKYVFFLSGIYSQWHKAEIEIDGIVYNTCEQYMMHQKAVTFGDAAMAQKILETDDPAEQKGYGRLIKGFDKAVWDKACFDIVLKGNIAKFTQHPNLGKKLVETGTRILAEASPKDAIWGIGMHETNPNIEDESKWGTNLLGKVLMKTRDYLNEK
jgi:ribA/ribD-fused uncharacterized protein